ncbi:MAG: gliding motility lipoprotein GldJ [Bacteroidetes bacterium]|nr:gliding motility lipoprotein GldJ [Bacteroidota bacterium]
MINKKSLIRLSTAAIAVVLVSSCSKERSPVTGWAYNDPKNGGFEVVPYDEQETGPGLVLIEGGTFTMGRVEQDVNYDWSNIPRRVTVSSFYMDETEVRNLDYGEYLHWTGRVFNANFPDIYQRALPDTLVWREKMAFNEPYVEYYFRHPAYRDYPVVGVNWLQANDFCAWRTDRVNEFIMIREGLLEHVPTPSDADYFNTDQYMAGKWTGTQKQKLPSFDPNSPDRNVKMEDGIFLPRYRLPTEAEWEYACYGLIGNTIGERITDRRIYPWNGHGVRNPDEKAIGQMMANFKRGAGDMMGAAGYLNDNADVTAPVYSYWPNDYGLYNMAGNVSEWVMDTYRPMSSEDKDDFRAFRGNVFKTQVKDVDGIVVNTDSVLYDKDSNIVSIPGMVKMRDVSIAYNVDNLDERRNYKKSDNISYLDGDIESSVYFTQGEDANSLGNKLMYEYSVYSMINDKAKVFKGGSWRDRAYYMSPGTRRFLDQRQATSYLGFRCAMTRVGSPVGLGK